MVAAVNVVAIAIRAVLQDRQWAQADLARVLGWSVQATSELMKGKRRLDATMALELSAITSTSAAQWLVLQNVVDLEEAERKCAGTDRLRFVTVRAELEDVVPVRELVRRRLISRSDPDKQAAEARALIGDDPTFGASAKRSESGRPFTRAQTAWIAIARQQAERVARTRYDAGGLLELARSLPRRVTTPADFVGLPQQFAAVGVPLIHVEAFPGGRIDGVSLGVGGRPMIALSGRGKRIDKVLFALLHECAHVAAGHWEEAPRVHEDGHECSVGNDTAEREVSKTAASWCFPAGLSSTRPVTRQQITDLAAEHGVAEALVVGSLQFNGILEWSSILCRGLPTVDKELRSWTPD